MRVARENVADSRWYPGTGIYRNTWLTVTDPIHVVRHGSFATTPMVDDARAEVNSTCEVRNDSAADATVTVDRDGPRRRRSDGRPRHPVPAPFPPVRSGPSRSIIRWPTHAAGT